MHLGFLVFAYLLGAIPFGVLAARRRGIDLTAVGSGNIGTTNVWRTLGPVDGTAVFMLDVAKGALPPMLARSLFAGEAETWAAAGALAAVLGHTFSVFLRLRGGKGIATGLGVALGLAPIPALAVFAWWGLVLFLTRIISVASLAACVAMPLALGVAKASPPVLAVLTLIVVVAIIKHFPNIQRLRRGQEPRIGRRPTAPAAPPAEAAPTH